MITWKDSIAGVLLLVSLLAVTQSVQSQQYATTTLTTLVTSNQPSTVTVGTQVMTTTSGLVTPVYVGPNVTITGTHGVCGEYFVQPFNGTAGEVLTGSISASGPVNIYVMTSTVYQAWEHQVVAGGTCTPSSSVASQISTRSYSMNIMVPAAGTYDLVVHNLSESTVTAQVTANLVTAAPSLVTMVAYSTVTQPMVQTLMQTSTQTLQITAQTMSSGPDMTTIAAIIFAIIIIAAAAYIAKTRQSKNQKK